MSEICVKCLNKENEIQALNREISNLKRELKNKENKICGRCKRWISCLLPDSHRVCGKWEKR